MNSSQNTYFSTQNMRKSEITMLATSARTSIAGHKIAILAGEISSLFELSCAVELFILPRPEFREWYSGDVVSFGNTQVQSSAGLSFSVTAVSDFSDYDTVLVPSWPVEQSPIDKALKRTLLDFHLRGGRLVSFCSGAFLLGRLGILDNREATTHWRYSEQFEQEFPHTQFKNNVLFVDQGSVATSAGSAAALDLGIELIRQDFGARAAQLVAKRLVVSPYRKGGQAQFSEQLNNTHRGDFENTLTWVQNNLQQSIRVEDMAQSANMSRRTFDRQFKLKMGQSPNAWIVSQRIELARSILENSNPPLEQLAELSGFENAAALRHHFKRRLGVTPRQYKDQFLAQR